jgi:hypothetical protein
MSRSPCPSREQVPIRYLKTRWSMQNALSRGIRFTCPTSSRNSGIRDLALPIGPPVFLTFLVLLLLIINGAIVWSRW